MQTDRIHCVVVRVPSPASCSSLGGGADERQAEFAAARHDEELLPWADPYILGLIEKLKREAVADRSAGVTLEFDDACFDFDMEIEELLADGLALAEANAWHADVAVDPEVPLLVRLPR